MEKSIKSGNAENLFKELNKIMATLRGADGCPWDKHQTHQTLIKYLFAESDEVKEAIEKQDWENLKEELGDILLQVVFHSRIAEENGIFNIADVVQCINEKLRRRHPHVFGGKKLHSPEDVNAQWEQIKTEEKKTKQAKVSQAQRI